MIRLTEKQALFSKYMFTIGSKSFGNGVESARRAGYKGSYGTLNQISIDNLQKPIIKAEKQRIQAESEEKLEIDRDFLIEETRKVFKASVSETVKIRALSLIGDFIGAKQESAPNSESEAAKMARMSDEERLFRVDWEKERCKVLSIKSLREA